MSTLYIQQYPDYPWIIYNVYKDNLGPRIYTMKLQLYIANEYTV